MKSEKISLVFFGSGPVAAESLVQLAEHFLIEAVVTKPTTEQEMHAACPSAKVYCVQNKLDLDTLIAEKQFSSRVGVLIDFGIIVSQSVIDYFEKSIVNSHFSLLPEWRGADPITFSILSGQTRTGVSLMLLVEAMDEGPVLSSGIYDMNGNETTPILTKSLISLSTSLLSKNLPEYLNGNLQPREQTNVAQSNGISTVATYSRKLVKEDGRIDWAKPAQQIEREIRAYAGWPKSYTRLGDIECVITKAHVEDQSGTPGSLHVEGKNLGVYCAEGRLMIERLLPAGKKEMDVVGFLAGYRDRLTQ